MPLVDVIANRLADQVCADRVALQVVTIQQVAFLSTVVVVGQGLIDLLLSFAEQKFGVRVIDDSELTVEFDEPLGIFPAVLTHSSLAIVPEGSDQIAGAWRDSCVGTGPFRVTRFEPGLRLDQDANPDYWRAGFPRSGGLSHRFAVAQAEILAGFKDGRFSLAWNLDAADRESLRNDPEYGPLLHEYPTLATYFLVFNAHSGPLADESLRRRLFASVDIDALARASFGASAMAARRSTSACRRLSRATVSRSPTRATRSGSTCRSRAIWDRSACESR